MNSNSETSVCEDSVFEKVFKNYAQEIRNFMYARTGNDELARDLVQEAFLKLWINCAKIPFNKARSFLYAVVKNAHYNVLDHQRIVLKYRQNFKHQLDHQDPEFKLREKEFEKRLNDALNKLKPKDREVFLLNRIEKKKYKEIADILEISIKTVEKRMHDALLGLRKDLKNFKF